MFTQFNILCRQVFEWHSKSFEYHGDVCYESAIITQRFHTARSTRSEGVYRSDNDGYSAASARSREQDDVLLMRSLHHKHCCSISWSSTIYWRLCLSSPIFFNFPEQPWILILKLPVVNRWKITTSLEIGYNASARKKAFPNSRTSKNTLWFNLCIREHQSRFPECSRKRDCVPESVAVVHEKNTVNL